MNTKILLILLFAITFGNLIHAQSKAIHIPERNKTWGYTAETEKARADQFKMTSLITDTTTDKYYRLSNSRQIMDVWKKDTLFKGQVISFTNTIPLKRKGKK